jgi:pimeloyl-ACP methyl ester carboxylesterase
MSANWLLLRGLMREQRHWEGFPARLQRCFPDARVILADLPGFGREYHKSSPSRIPDITDWLREHWQAERSRGPLKLLALSLGGMVALDWARRYPAEVSAVVLINSSLAGISPFYHRLRPSVYWPLLKWCLWQRDPLRQEATILQLTSQYFADDLDIMTRWAAYARECPPSRRNTLLLSSSPYPTPAAHAGAEQSGGRSGRPPLQSVHCRTLAAPPAPPSLCRPRSASGCAGLGLRADTDLAGVQAPADSRWLR